MTNERKEPFVTLLAPGLKDTSLMTKRTAQVFHAPRPENSSLMTKENKKPFVSLLALWLKDTSLMKKEEPLEIFHAPGPENSSLMKKKRNDHSCLYLLRG